MLRGRCSRRCVSGLSQRGPITFGWLFVRRVAGVGVTEDGGMAAVSECCGQSVAEPAVVVLELGDAVGGGSQAVGQRGVRGPLPVGRHRGCGRRVMAGSEPLDLGP